MLHPCFRTGSAAVLAVVREAGPIATSPAQTMQTTKLKSDGEVLRTAVAQIDDQSATALVIADAHATSVFGERVRHFRWKVSLVRDPDDANHWLVDDFEAVA